ncbi:MAG: CDP-alcohol phosphatidyltransferase family protein [Gammaproteobacteria bacterium]|nr:CDP-alcohol phosphatidyltransferase family protein [Gammaproteobacteria bacterium]
MTKNASVRLLGEVQVRLWGLELREWQRRAWLKIGAVSVDDPAARLLVGTEWVMSPALQLGLLTAPGAVLIIADSAGAAPRIAALHLPEGAESGAYESLIGQTDFDEDALRAAGFTTGGIDDFAGAYNRSLRKREAPYALSMRLESLRDVEKRLFKGAYKGVTDIVTKYVWPLPAFHVTRAAAALHISPNTVTTFSLMLVIVAFWQFWNGAWAWGITAAWAMTFLDTVDGKLARTTMRYTKLGGIYDHGIDLIHPPFWYWAIWHGLEHEIGGPGQAMLDVSLAVIVVSYVLNRLEEGAFMRKFGFHIHVWQRIDSLMREITARRNPNMVIFMLAVMLGAPGWGLVAIAVWTVICLVFHGFRLYQAIQQPPKISWLAD